MITIFIGMLKPTPAAVPRPPPPPPGAIGIRMNYYII